MPTQGSDRPRTRASSRTAAVGVVIAVVLGLVSSTPVPAGASGVSVVTDTGGQVLFVRPTPDQGAAPIGSLADGQSVRVDCYTTSQTVSGPQGPSSIWHRLNGRSGWVSGAYLEGGRNGGVSGEPRCATTGPNAPPDRYTLRNQCGTADITFTKSKKQISVKMYEKKIQAVLDSGYTCLAARVAENWISRSEAAKWAKPIRNEIRNHALLWVKNIKRDHANPADLDFNAYARVISPKYEWAVDLKQLGASMTFLRFVASTLR